MTEKVKLSTEETLKLSSRRVEVEELAEWLRTIGLELVFPLVQKFG